MQNNLIFKKITQNINTSTQISPYLFIGNNLTSTKLEIDQLVEDLLTKFQVNPSNIFKIENSTDKIKIEQIKTLINRSFIKANNFFQIFIIESIDRLTLKAANSLLKFLEEPGIGNIVLLSNCGQQNILDTIISRVNIINVNSKNIDQTNTLFYSMIDNYKKYGNPQLFSYFYKQKLEKKDYISFLKTMIKYGLDKHCFIDLLDEINDSINLIQKNNLLPKYQLDKFLLKI